MELYLIESLKHSMTIYDGDESELNRWQSQKLRGIKAFQKRNAKLIKEYTEKYTASAKESIAREYIKGVEEAEQLQQEAMAKGYKPKIRAPAVNTDGAFNDRKLTSLIQAVDNDFKTAAYAVLRQADDIYRQTIFKTLTFFNSDSVTLKDAWDMAAYTFLEKGITSIRYRNGRNVNIASYAEMYLRTANQRAFLQGEGSRRREWGESLVIITTKGVACPKCIKWLGKICIDDIYSGGRQGDYAKHYPLLSKAYSEGYQHPNCQDTHTGYYEGINAPAKVMTKTEIESASNNYKLEQRQRYNERQIRRYKRLAAGSQDPANIDKYNKKVRQWQGIQREFIKKHPQLHRDYHREKNYFT